MCGCNVSLIIQYWVEVDHLFNTYILLLPIQGEGLSVHIAQMVGWTVELIWK